MGKKKTVKKSSRDISGWTRPSQFRLSADTLARLDWLKDRYGTETRAAVLRRLIHEQSTRDGYSV